jgi:Co/Zn/Cd efflux system component
LLSGSLALLSGCLHNFEDTASLGISLAAVRLSRSPDRLMTFGYRRAQIIGAVNQPGLACFGRFLFSHGGD